VDYFNKRLIILILGIIVILGVYIFSCSGEHATNEESVKSDSSAVVKTTRVADMDERN